MCDLAFADLASSVSSTKVVVSQAEYESWKHSVKDMYVCVNGHPKVGAPGEWKTEYPTACRNVLHR
jgi:hypothetical protein